jgi:hypothetical protein
MGQIDRAAVEKAGGTREEMRTVAYNWSEMAGYLMPNAVATWTVSLFIRSKIEDRDEKVEA